MADSPAPARLNRLRVADGLPLGVYVHFPWCESKCPYCDFNSHKRPPRIPVGRYLDCLRADLEAALPRIRGRRVSSLYLGGGTPSLFPPEAVDRLLSDLRMLLPLAPGAEVTMEANPGSVEAARFRDFAAAGVNRLSLGLQSLDDRMLRALGRAHDAAAARRAADIALACFERVNLDLITALPGQDVAHARNEARQLCAMGAGHVSIYRLTLEPGTRFHRQPPPGMPGHDLMADCEDAARAEAAAAGYRRYEISAHCKAGEEGMHNVNYWLFGDYLGVGAGAHSKVSAAGRVGRAVRHKPPQRYMERAMAGDAVARDWEVAPRELPFEFMLNGLRLVGGFDEALFAQRTGLLPRVVEGALREARERGWLVRECGKIRATQAGLDFQNDLCMLFLSTSDGARRATLGSGT